jgi:hypothetical protein
VPLGHPLNPTPEQRPPGLHRGPLTKDNALLASRVYPSSRMIPKRKRPVGITLLSLVFLWIGCIGPIAVALAGINADFAGLSGGLLDRWVQSPAMLHLVSVVPVILFLSFYLFYAFVGWGLWKLKNWARLSLLAISAIGIVWAIAFLALFSRFGILGWTTFFFETMLILGLVWYLKRPRVLYAFGVLPAIPGAPPLARPPSAMSKRGIFFVVTGVLGVLAVFAAGLYLSIEQFFHNSDPYKLALIQAADSPCVISKVGTPFSPGRYVNGSMEDSEKKGKAAISFTIQGPKGKADLDVHAKKEDGVWTITTLNFIQDDITTSIVPALPYGCN